MIPRSGATICARTQFPLATSLEADNLSLRVDESYVRVKGAARPSNSSCNTAMSSAGAAKSTPTSQATKRKKDPKAANNILPVMRPD
jgi:hypothetical protein